MKIEKLLWDNRTIKHKKEVQIRSMLFFLIALQFWTCNPTPVNSPKEVLPKISVRNLVDSTSKALQSQPPIFQMDYDSTQWTEVTRLIPTIVLDMRYATTDNFVKEKLYDCGRCFLRPGAAMALSKIQVTLQQKGLGLKMFDCFRPRPIQQKLWDMVPNPSYVTRPSKGSMHNRGLAVDVTIVNSTGKELDMGTGFDFFGRKAHQDYTNLPKEVLDNRKLLKETFEKFGFRSIRTEWWHYSYRVKKHPLSDMRWSCQN